MNFIMDVVNLRWLFDTQLAMFYSSYTGRHLRERAWLE